jgi:hypothetical protein
MVLQVGLQPVLGDFGYVLSGQATKFTVLMRPKDLFCVNFELVSQISLDQWSFRLAFRQPGWFWHCFGWPGHKIHCPCEAKDIFCFNFGQEWHLPTSNLVLVQNILQKVNQGPVLFLETLQSPVDFFRRAKLLGLPHKFCTLPRHFCRYQWFVYIRWNQRWAAFQRMSQKISVTSRCLNILIQKLS